jgi:DNA-binding beta-propeller fold protein YncE
LKILEEKEPNEPPHQISIDNFGYVYLTDKNSHQIIKFDDNGKFIKVLGTRGSEAGQFYRPHGIIFDADNNMSITDMRNSRVQVLDKDFPLVTQWGSYGNGSGKFSLTFPGIDIYEKAGLVFVIDKIATNVQIFDQSGKFISKFWL